MAPPRADAAAALGDADLGAVAQALLCRPALLETLPLAAPSVDGARRAPWAAFLAVHRGCALGPAAQREVLGEAYARFDACGDRLGALLSCAGVIETFYFDETALAPLDLWIARLQTRLPAQWAHVEAEALVMACGVGVMLRDPQHPLLHRWAARGPVLLRQLPAGPLRARLALALVQYHLWRGEFGASGLVLDGLPGLDAEGLPPAHQLLWHESVASHARFTGQFERGQAAVAAALALAARHGLASQAYALHTHGAALALAAGDAQRAARHVEAMQPGLALRPQEDQTHYWHLHAGLALLQGDTDRALASARLVVEHSREIGGPYRSAVHRFSLGAILLARHEPAGAEPLLRAALDEARAIEADMLRFSIGLMLSAALAALMRSGDADEALREALQVGSGHDYRATSGWWLPALVAERLARALEQDMAADFVRRFIRHTRLPAPASRPWAWPWPLRLQALGEFRAWRDDVPLSASGARAQQRPLDLLRAVLAHDGAQLPVTTAMDWLWPDADRAAQRKAFDAALARLRRLLGDERLLRLDGGVLLLDPAWCWSDVAALGDLARQAARATDNDTRLQLADALTSLVRGVFLPDLDTPWVLGARERWRRRFVVAATQLAEALVAVEPDAAARLYERALDVDPLAEALYRQLMALHGARGDQAEALRVWRQCQVMLALHGGLAPAAQTRALAQRLHLH